MDEKLKNLIIENPNRPTSGYIGYIYVFYNTINHKIYVGKTTELYLLRFNEHKYNAFTKNAITYLYNSLRKYGWDAFERYVIFQTEELENKIEVDKIILEKEIYYINFFNSNNPQFGYNMTEGGDGICGFKFSEESKKKISESHKGEKHWNYGNLNNKASDVILQFDLDFNFIKEWPSMNEIARQLNCNANNISRCCANKSNTYLSFIWVKKEDYYDGYLQKYKSRAKCKSNDKCVIQYDFLGNFVNKYISCSEAARQLELKSPSSINKAATGSLPHAHTYIWIYEQDFTEELLKEKLEAVKTARFYNKIVNNLKNEYNNSEENQQ